MKITHIGLVIGLLLVLILKGSGSYREKATDWYEQYERAKEFLFKNEYDKAINLFLRVIEKNPRFIKAYASIGTAYYRKGEYEYANSYWQKGLIINPQEKGILAMLDMLNYNLQEGINKINKDDWKVYFFRAQKFYRDRKYKEAVAELERASVLSHGSFDIYFMLGATYRKLDQFELAVEYWQKALNIKPDDKLVGEFIKMTKDLIAINREKDAIKKAGKLDVYYSSMIFIEGGEFIMGSSEKDGRIGIDIGVDELPQHKVYVSSYYIDRFEVPNYLYKRFVEETGHRTPNNETHPEDIYIWKDGTYKKGDDYYPVVLVDWYDANTYCLWSGKRLPTEAEWEKAARGTDGRIWPWGNIWDITRSNTADLELNSPRPVDSFRKGMSPYGVYNMSGNVWEWTSSVYKAYPGSKLKRNSFNLGLKVQRGGGWTAMANPYARAASRGSYPLYYKHRSIGFRCARAT